MNFEFSFCFGELFYVHVFRLSTMEDVKVEDGVSFHAFFMYLKRDLLVDVNRLTLYFRHDGISGNYGDYYFNLRKLS